MSRSYKKKSIIKDKNRGMQKAGSKGVRRVTKTKLKNVDPEKVILPEDPSEIINSYSVTDWRQTKDLKGRGKKDKRVNK